MFKFLKRLIKQEKPQNMKCVYSVIDPAGKPIEANSLNEALTHIAISSNSSSKYYGEIIIGDNEIDNALLSFVPHVYYDSIMVASNVTKDIFDGIRLAQRSSTNKGFAYTYFVGDATKIMKYVNSDAFEYTLYEKDLENIKNTIKNRSRNCTDVIAVATLKNSIDEFKSMENKKVLQLVSIIFIGDYEDKIIGGN